jgi:hypothetical protein
MNPEARNGPMDRDDLEVIVFSSTATNNSIAGRPPKPRAYVVPVVRPAPPRPSAAGSDGTW